MKTLATLLLLLLVLVCVGCGTVNIIEWKVLPNDDIYAMVSLRDLPVGHVVKESDVMATKIGRSRRDLLHPLSPRPNTEFTIDATKIIGHTVKTFVRESQAISLSATSFKDDASSSMRRIARHTLGIQSLPKSHGCVLQA